MNKHVSFGAAAALATTLINSAWSFELQQTNTEALIGLTDRSSPAVRVRFDADLRGPIANLTEVDVDVDWGDVGGIAPCIRIHLPAGCFVSHSRGFYVEDFARCGAEVSLEAEGRVLARLQPTYFDAQLKSRGNDTARFVVETIVETAAGNPPDDGTPATLLGILGGAKIVMTLGREMQASLPGSIESKSGIQPTPFKK